MDHLRQDVRQALRLFRSTPGFSILAVLMLAIGIGANTAIFSAVSAMLLRPLPIPGLDRVVYGVALREGFDPFGTGLLEYDAIRSSVAELTSIGLASQHPVNIIDGDEPERLTGVDVTASFLATLDVGPALGRRLTPEDDRPSSPPVVLIGDDLWRRRFNARPDIAGQPLKTDEGVWTIVGVMPRGFDQPNQAELWIPARLDTSAVPLERRAQHNWELVARLAAGATIESVDAALKAVAARIERENPQTRRGWTYAAVPLRRQLLLDVDGQREHALYVLTGAVGFVLLICCANVAGLLLVRGMARQREFAVRLAMGASAARIVRQLMTESAVLAVISGLAGLILASWLMPLIGAVSPVRTAAYGAMLSDFRLDGRVLIFTAAITAAAALVFGFVPALRTLGGRDLATALKRREQRTTTDTQARRWLNALVIAEIAIAASLLVSGSLMVQSFGRLQRVELGFRPDHVLAMQLSLPASKYTSQPRRVEFAGRLLARVRALPGVTGAGISTNLPLDDLSYDSVFAVEGRPPAGPSEVPITAHRMVSAGYLESLGVRLLKGRLIDEGDRRDSRSVVVVTDEFARQAWPGDANPIGRRVRRVTANDSAASWITVVGIVADTKEDQINFRIRRPAWYLPYAQVDTTAPVNLLVRTSGDPSALAGAVREVVRSLDPAQPIANVRPLSSQVGTVTVRDRFNAVLVAALAGVGILLATCGLYGVVAYSVHQRRSELGLRSALGAAPAALMRLVMGHGVWLIAGGLATGLVAARVLTWTLAAMLYEVRPGDPLTYAAVAVLLAAVSLFACYLPARKAARVDPTIALRAD
jgi:putative ABC transport system permease protein